MKRKDNPTIIITYYGTGTCLITSTGTCFTTSTGTWLKNLNEIK